jgi:hypothetical protein
MLWLLLFCTYVVGLVYVFMVYWFIFFTLCVAVPVVSCSGSVFEGGDRVYVLLTGIYFLQCSEYFISLGRLSKESIQV